MAHGQEPGFPHMVPSFGVAEVPTDGGQERNRTFPAAVLAVTNGSR